MRNGAFEETFLLADLAPRIQGLLPTGWTARVEQVSEPPLDATVYLAGPKGAFGAFDVAVKRWTTAPSSAVTGVLSRIQMRAANPMLLVTDYTSRPLREACESLGISFIDNSGWTLIKLEDPPIYIFTQGVDKAAPRRANEVVRLNGIAVGRIIRTLLETQPPIGVRELADRATVKSPGSVSKLLPTLLAADAIERDDAGQIIAIRRRALLQRWTQDYGFLNGNGLVLDYLSPRGVEPVLDRLCEMSRVAITGGIAGTAYLNDQTVPVVPTPRLTLYARDLERVASELNLVRIARAASNVIIAAPRDAESMESPQRDARGLPVAALPQVLADLLTLPGRESLLAEQLMDQLAETDPLWSPDV